MTKEETRKMVAAGAAMLMQAQENLERFGRENVDILLLCAQEQLGDLTKAYLTLPMASATMRKELIHLGALCVQMLVQVMEEKSK